MQRDSWYNLYIIFQEEAAVFELVQVSENNYYIQSPAKIGLVRLDDKRVILIDSGNDKEAGKKVLRLLEANSWELVAVYNTHSNADHIGGNKFLQDRTGCKVYAPGIECDFTNHPILEPALLYGGNPPKPLRHKFLMAKESKALPLTEDVLPEGVEMISLPGHFFDMAGFRTADGVVYLADALSSKATLDKYVIGFLYDVGAYLETLEKIKGMEAKLFIPSHAEPCEDITELCDYNIKKVQEVAEKIREIAAEPTGFDAILQRLFCEYKLVMTAEQHALVGSTVKSYLSYLTDSGKLVTGFDNNIMTWCAL